MHNIIRTVSVRGEELVIYLLYIGEYLLAAGMQSHPKVIHSAAVRFTC